ncbi:MAG TPA: DUF1622 domain-containing protein [Ktedonobacteraceae bacterium]|jgi:uncharacterized membrane protein
MPITNLFDVTLWAALIEFGGALLIIGYLLAALLTVLHTRDIQLARLQAATGVVTGLSFKLAGTLLKTIQLRTWQQILMFVAIFTLRTVLKRFFTWEQERLRHREDAKDDMI